MAEVGNRRVLTLTCATSLLLFAFGWTASADSISLSGSFSGGIESMPSQLVGLDRFVFGVTLRDTGWHTSLRAAVSSGDFSYLGLSDNRQVGPISLASVLVFDPSQATFTYASHLTRFQVEGIGFANYAYYPADNSQAYDQVTLNGFTEGVRWRAVSRFGLCELDFRTASLRADWLWDPCGLAFGASLSFSCDGGFDRFRLAVTYPEVPHLSLGPMATDFILDVDFQTGAKTVSPSLRARLARASVCAAPLYALDVGAAPLSIEGLTLYGVKLEATAGDAVDFYAATSFVSTRNAELTGSADYFEVYRLRVSPSSCCGPGGLLEVAFFFDGASPWAFDLGMVSASADFPVSARGRLRFGIEYPASGDWVLRSGWEWRF